MFSSYLSNGDESGENDHGNEFRESKNGGKEVWVGLKWPKNEKIWRPKVAAATVFVGPIRARPAADGGELLRPRSSGGGSLDRPKNVSKRPSSGFSGFLSGFGVGSSLGTQN